MVELLCEDIKDSKVFSNESISDLACWLKVISEPNRLLLLEKIMEGVQCNCELGGDLHMAPNLISHHLSVLREAGLVEVDRDPFDGRWVYYSINQKAMDELSALVGGFFDTSRIRLRRLTCGPQAVEGLLKRG